ncbi:MAG: hypothetical protein NE328_17185 [Lentisphaeraceae bacterium]|nr:hypothetical protein [Lentisphaeraceae bacterium]
MDISEAIEISKLYIEKSEKLKNSTYLKSIINSLSLGFSAKLGEPVVLQKSVPNQESVDAFVLTFRFFIQNNEKISLRCMRDFFDSDFIQIHERNGFNKIRNELNSYLDNISSMNINGGIIRRQLLETIVYGGLSHANKDKKEVYDVWRNDSFIWSFYEFEFNVILSNILNAILCIQSIVLKVLSRLED